MHIVLVCDMNSSWVKDYIESVFIPRRINVTILTGQENKHFKEFYTINNIGIINYLNGKILSTTDSLGNRSRNIKQYKSLWGEFKNNCKIFLPNFTYKFVHKIRMYMRLKHIFKKIGNVDAIQFLYIKKTIDDDFYLFLKRFLGKVIFTYVGSDLLRIPLTDKTNCRTLQLVSNIVCDSNVLINKFISIYGHGFDNKIKCVHFPNNLYNKIDVIKNTKIIHDNGLFSIPKAKIRVAIGTNANPAHQHLKILNAIDSLPQAIKSMIHIYVQLSYGFQPNHDEYYTALYDKINNINISSDIIDKFIDEQNLALLRCSTDILIHAQATDAFSGTMLEILYSGGLLLNGSWLKYNELEMLGIYSLSFESFNSLSIDFTEIIANFHEHKRRASKNHNIIYSLNSPNAVCDSWLSLFTA